jgi:uncharacterized protein YndB with AHSA1/START domain
VKPIVVEFDVAASCEHAFDMWAGRTSLWWPPGHTVSGDENADIVFEGMPGGRIFERAGDGTEFDWGRVVVWEPPHRLAYSWHLFFPPEEATDIEVTFTPVGELTAVRIEQSGWDRLGAAGQPRRARTQSVWQSLTPAFIEVSERSASDPGPEA